MLVELRVEALGVIEELSLLFETGMTALTGETGAGKTLVVEAIELLVGARADPMVVRHEADEARVEGRFIVDGEEHVLARVVPRDGRSRAYIDGRLATVTALAELGGGLVDLHGQHTAYALLQPAVQRSALDRFAGIDLAPWQASRARLADLDEHIAALGGDARARTRELDLLHFQIDEIDGVAITSVDEDEQLAAHEAVLADADAHREAASRAQTALEADDGGVDRLRTAAAALAGRPPFASLAERLRSTIAELDDIATDIRTTGEGIVADPERLAAVRSRRESLHALRRKYGEDLGAVLAFRSDAVARRAELESHDERVAELERERRVVDAERAAQATAIAGARRAAAPSLSEAIQANLRTLGLPQARVEIEVNGADPADEILFGFSANAGDPLLALAKAASGGELARAMLAMRLVLTESPPTLVFDEVDSGIGGEAALVVGRALARLPGQVLVVTHLPQVAAFADHQIAVRKVQRKGRATATATAVSGDERVTELSRMMTGLASSDSAREHAAELLEVAAKRRRR